jgi:glycine hydroxymethyltransferase
LLPRDEDTNNPSGLRIGVQEMTRYGMKEGDMQELAALMKAGLEGKVVKNDVVQLRSRFTEVHYA